MKVYLAMIFVVFEILSMIFNNFFVDTTFDGITLPLNISVVFFCLGFFILDLVTEIYDSTEANKLIYGKIICQIAFVLFAEIGIKGSGLENSQFSEIIYTSPIMVCYSAIASYIGYKITSNIMQKLKLYYKARFLMVRYLCSTLPGEIVFSLIFAGLSFRHGRSFSQFITIFLSLMIIKLVLSILFAIIIVPITRLLQLFVEENNDFREYLPFS